MFGKTLTAYSPTSPKNLRNFRINEWTFSLFLFVLSLTIVAAKLYINHVLPSDSGSGTQWPIDMKKKTASERLINVSQEYGDAMAGALVGIMHTYSWLFRALLSGLATQAFSWIIIFNDSHIPGVNPHLPFYPRDKRFAKSPRLQINYFIGVLIGVLVFVYMCF